MAHFAFITWDGGGNVSVALGIGGELVARGHRVTVLGPQSLASAIADAGLNYTELGISPPSDPSARADYLVQIVGSTTLSDQFPIALAHVKPDALVIDCNLSWALNADLTMKVGVLVHTALGLYLPVWQPVIDRANQRRTAAGLPPFRDAATEWLARDVLLIASIEQFDRAPSQLPRNASYVGPVLQPRRRRGLPPPGLETSRDPLVLISYSTDRLQNSAPRIQAALNALSEVPVRVLATTSKAFDPALLSIPTNAAVVEDVNLDEVLSSVAIAVVHGGHGTTLSALCHGLPVVCVPGIGRDQIPIATRVAELGLGIAVLDSADVGAIRTAVRAILADPAFRARTSEFGSRCEDMSGAKIAADRLEGMLIRG